MNNKFLRIYKQLKALTAINLKKFGEIKGIQNLTNKTKKYSTELLIIGTTATAVTIFQIIRAEFVATYCLPYYFC